MRASSPHGSTLVAEQSKCYGLPLNDYNVINARAYCNLFSPRAPGWYQNLNLPEQLSACGCPSLIGVRMARLVPFKAFYN